MATDFETGQLYVADKGNERIDVFEPDGTFVRAFGWDVIPSGQPGDTGTGFEVCTSASTCKAGIAGSGSGQFNRPEYVAVDNDPASASQHDLYVGEDENHRVQKFDASGAFLLAFGKGGGGAGEFNRIKGVGVASAGTVYVADTLVLGVGEVCKTPGVTGGEYKKRVQIFDESGGFVKAIEPSDAPCGPVDSFAVDSSGAFYLHSQGNSGAIRKYSPSAVPACEVDRGDQGSKSVATTALAIDPSDDLVAGQEELEAKPPNFRFYRLVTQFDSNCNHLRRFGYGAFEQPIRGVAAFHSGFGDVFASEEEHGLHYLSPPPPGPVVAPPSLEANPISNTKATLNAEVNPEGSPTNYHFEYVAEATFEKDVEELGEGHGFDNAAKTPETPIVVNPEEDPDEFRLHFAQAQIGCADPVKEAGEGKCLAPDTAYRFRILAKHADESTGNTPLEGKFTTKPPLEFGALWSTSVGVDAAVLHGEVNPLGIPTSGWFEYVDDATYQKDLKELGEGHGFDHALQSPAVDEGETPIDFGASETFTVKSTSLFGLSPGATYHYRLVAEDPLIEPLPSEEQTFRTFAVKPPEACQANEAFRAGPSSSLPDCRAYEMVSPLDKESGDIVALGEFSTVLPAVLNQSSVTGSKLAYGSYRAFGDAASAPYTSQYIATRHAGEGWQSHGITPPRGRPIFGVLASLDTEFKAFSPDLCEAWLRTVSEPRLDERALAGYPNIYRRGDEECGGERYQALTALPWLNLLPGEQKAATLELQGVAADGEHAIFIAPDSLEGSGAPDLKGGALQLYVWAGGDPVFACVLPGGKALKEACTGGGAGEGDGHHRSATVQGAISGDGSRVFWTASGTGPGKIYLREHPEQGQVEGECEAGNACTIAVSKEAEELSGLSGSRFLAAANDSGKAVFATGEDLYEFDVGSETTTLIAHHALPGYESGALGVSEDASRVYFASTEVMAATPNSEGDVAQAGKPNLYLYHEGGYAFIGTLAAKDIPSNAPPQLLSPIARQPRSHLARVSADGLHAAFMSTASLTGYDNTDALSGQADAEVFLYDASDNGGAGKLLCVTCNPSGARPRGANIGAGGGSQLWAAARIPVPENTLYAARVLSKDGKRLFFNSTDALAPADTNARQDVYQWEAASTGGCDVGDASFSAAAQGCIEPISTGQSPKSSEFIDASPSGEDVFFATLSSLVPPDYGLVDIYDARVNGGLPSPPAPRKECEGEACQSPPGTPNAPSPASEAIGPPRQALPARRCPKGRHLVRRKGKASCLAPHKRKAKQRKRAKR